MNRHLSIVERATSNLGARQDRPFKIYVPLHYPDLAERIRAVSMAAGIAAKFRHSKTTFQTPEVTPETTALLATYPFEKQIYHAKAPERLARLYNFWPTADLSKADRYNVSLGLWHDFFLTPSMVARRSLSKDDIHPLNRPGVRSDDCEDPLESVGLDPALWVFLMETDPEAVRPWSGHLESLRDQIVGPLGGQVLRLRHPGQEPWNPTTGFTELEYPADDLGLLASWVSRSCAHLGTDPVASALAHAYGVATEEPDLPGHVRDQDDVAINGMIGQVNRMLDDTADGTEFRKPHPPGSTPTNAFPWPPRVDESAEGSRRRTSSTGDPVFRMTAPIFTPAFGDVLIGVKVAASIAMNFERSHTIFLARPSPSYIEDILALYPFSYDVVLIDSMSDIPGLHEFSDGQKRAIAYEKQDFVVPPMKLGSADVTGAYDCPLRIPDAWTTSLEEQFAETGVDRDRWFCCLHYREPNYAHKTISNLRDVDPTNYLLLRDFIIDELGGQVVRLGHPEMAVWPERPGFVDLSRRAESWRLQFHAMTRARFFIGSGSGATCVAMAFNVPSAHTDIGDFYTGRKGDLILSHEIATPDGERLMQQPLAESGLFSIVDLDILQDQGTGYTIRKNTPEELFAAARQIFDRTSSTGTWRTPAAPIWTGTNAFTWPPRRDYELEFVDL